MKTAAANGGPADRKCCRADIADFN